jgi:hypothetical protein
MSAPPRDNGLRTNERMMMMDRTGIGGMFTCAPRCLHHVLQGGHHCLGLRLLLSTYYLSCLLGHTHTRKSYRGNSVIHNSQYSDDPDHVMHATPSLSPVSTLIRGLPILSFIAAKVKCRTIFSTFSFSFSKRHLPNMLSTTHSR